MVTNQKKHYTMEELENSYQEVTVLYDLAEELVELVEHKEQSNPDAQLALVAPLLDELTDATDVLTEEFILVAKGARYKINHTASKTRIEGAMRRVYVALNQYRSRSKRAANKIGKAMKQLTDDVVNQIHRQTEKIIGIFVDFIQLSLNSIMSKAEMEQIRARETRVAFMLHQMSQQGQGGSI